MSEKKAMEIRVGGQYKRIKGELRSYVDQIRTRFQVKNIKMSIENTKVIVTGAADGIGLEYVKQLLKNGAKVSISSV